LRIDRDERETESHGSKRWIGVAIAAVVLAAMGGAGWWFLGDARAYEVDVATTTAPSANTASAAVLQATGYVTARREATVSAQITGTMTELKIEEGVRVEAGQVIALLDDTAQKAALAQAQAQMRAAQAQRAQAQAQLAQNRRDLSRADDLVKRKLVSVQSAELARTQVDSQLAQVGEIVSPFSAGGGFTRTGIGTIVDMDSLEIEVDVNEAYIHRVLANQPVEAVLDAYPDWKIPGHVIAIIPTADRGKATVKVRVGFDQKDTRIVPDMGVRVSFLEDSSTAAARPAPPPNGVLVPASAIVQRDGRSGVFMVEGDRARLRPVTPGQDYGDLRLVEGIAIGARVVRQPDAALADGAKVQVRASK
jgi:multidrug efflux pump subunit AcrA (membrane-fusion protein)